MTSMLSWAFRARSASKSCTVDSRETSFGAQRLDIAFDVRNLEAFVRLGAAALRELWELRATPPA